MKNQCISIVGIQNAPLYGLCDLFWFINGSVKMIVTLAGLIDSRTFAAVVFSDVLFSLIMAFDLNFNF